MLPPHILHTAQRQREESRVNTGERAAQFTFLSPPLSGFACMGRGRQSSQPGRVGLGRTGVVGPTRGHPAKASQEQQKNPPSVAHPSLPPPRGRDSPSTSVTSSKKCVAEITNFGHSRKSVEIFVSNLANSAPAFSMRRGGGKRGKGGKALAKVGEREREREACAKSKRDRHSSSFSPPPPPLSQSIDSSPVLPPPPFLLLFCPPFPHSPKDGGGGGN